MNNLEASTCFSGMAVILLAVWLCWSRVPGGEKVSEGEDLIMISRDNIKSRPKGHISMFRRESTIQIRYTLSTIGCTD